MSAETRELISWVLGTIIALSAIVGILVRVVLVPYLKEHLFKPMRVVQRQVDENHHSNSKPTVLDWLSDVHSVVDEGVQDLKDQISATEQKIEARVEKFDERFNDHLITAAELSGKLASELGYIKQRLDRLEG